jgi:hypothetical protein
MWSPIPFLKILQHLTELKKVTPLGFYPPRRYSPRVPEMVWDAT